MPIYIETLAPESINADDVSALHTIYQDYPNTPPTQRLDAWHAQTLEHDWILLAARFNDRLLGAAWIQQDNQTLTIHDACVRSITRNRGVARRLFEHLHELSQSTQSTLALGHTADTADDQAIMEHLLTHRDIIGFAPNT